MTKSMVIAFDFDGTLTRSDTVVPFLRLVAREGDTMALVGRMAARSHKAVAAIARRDRDRLRALATEAVFAGISGADVDRLAAAYGRRVADQRLRPDTVDRLRWHRDQGHRVVIVSASYEPYLVVVADELGVERVLSTRLEIDADGICTGRLHGRNCRGDEKVRRLEAWFDDQGLAREHVELWAYGDSEGDRRLLEYADHPVWVGNPLDSVAAPA
jgi:phosphatidylglycerophosphatase C